MQIFYMNHSAFLIGLEKKVILMDYGTKPLRKEHGRIDEGVFDFDFFKDEYGLVGYSSHRHSDHYDEKLIKRFLDYGIPYILSDEASFPEEDFMEDKNFYRILPQTLTEIEGLKIANTGSTDQGGSILFEDEAADYSVYFGADLAVWDDFPEFYDGYAKEIAWLKEVKDQFEPVKVAFLPSGTGDGYQEDPLLDGAMEMIELLKPEYVIPIHGGSYPEYYPGFAEAIDKRAKDQKIEIGTYTYYDIKEANEDQGITFLQSKYHKDEASFAFKLFYPSQPGSLLII